MNTLKNRKVSFEDATRTKPDPTEGRAVVVAQSTPTQRATRRLSVRETILEENLANMNGKSDHHDVSKKVEQSYNVKELLQQLRDEKEQSEKLKMQVSLSELRI